MATAAVAFAIVLPLATAALAQGSRPAIMAAPPVVAGTPAPPVVATTAAPPVVTGTAPGLRRIVIVLDDSMSMRANDPQGLVKAALRSIVLQLQPTDRVGLVEFAGEARLLRPLQALGEPNAREVLLTAISSVDFDGQWTDIPAGVERGLYELKQGTEGDEPKLLVVVTDGRIETGNPTRDAERAAWLAESLLPEAAKRGVRVFGIAFTEKADWALLQAMGEATGGDYFRALSERDLADIPEKVAAALVPAPSPPSAPATQEVRVERVEVPVIVSTPARQPRWAIGALVLALLFGLTALGMALWRRHTEGQGVAPAFIEVALHDLTSGEIIRMDKKLLRIGRRAECDLVIDRPTISGQHALIEERDGVFYLKDLRSTNGTFLNDRKIDGETVLRNGDVIRFDRNKYAFEGVAADAADVGDQTLMRFSGDSTMVGTSTEEPANDGPGSATALQCVSHPHRAATESCASCGRAGCQVCIQDTDGSPLCSACS